MEGNRAGWVIGWGLIALAVTPAPVRGAVDGAAGRGGRPPLQIQRASSKISVDGVLDEAAWPAAPKQGSFTQRFPKDGAKPDVETQFSVLYDDEALYVGVWADDPEPMRIRRTLSRRDLDINADAIAVGIDSFHDKRTA